MNRTARNFVIYLVVIVVLAIMVQSVVGGSTSRAELSYTELLAQIDRRRRPVFPNLKRNHFLNRGAGILRARLSRSA